MLQGRRETPRGARLGDVSGGIAEHCPATLHPCSRALAELGGAESAPQIREIRQRWLDLEGPESRLVKTSQRMLERLGESQPQ